MLVTLEVFLTIKVRILIVCSMLTTLQINLYLIHGLYSGFFFVSIRVKMACLPSHMAKWLIIVVGFKFMKIQMLIFFKFKNIKY
jgi:hypothetical protein